MFGDKTALEICLHPMTDVMLADEKKMENKLVDISHNYLFEDLRISKWQHNSKEPL